MVRRLVRCWVRRALSLALGGAVLAGLLLVRPPGARAQLVPPAPVPRSETEPDPAPPPDVEPAPGAEGESATDESPPDAGPAEEVEPERIAPPPEPPEPDEVLDDDDLGEGEDVVGRLGDTLGEIQQALRPQPPPSNGRLQWDPSWPRYRFDELVVTLGAGLVIGLEELLPTRTDANWRGVSDLDLEVAGGLGLSSRRARDTVEEITDGLAAALFVWPVAIDPLLYAGLGEGAWDVAWQLSLLSLEVFALNHAVTVLVRLLARRERPLGRFCRLEEGYDADPICADQPPAEGFWSAHVSNAFAGAALMCMSHDVLDLYGDEAGDLVTCGAGLAAALTTGLFRIMSDYEYVTDVLTGAVVGSLSGILLPWLLHFQGGARPPLPGADVPTFTFYPMMGEDTVGGGVVGVW